MVRFNIENIEHKRQSRAYQPGAGVKHNNSTSAWTAYWNSNQCCNSEQQYSQYMGYQAANFVTSSLFQVLGAVMGASNPTQEVAEEEDVKETEETYQKATVEEKTPVETVIEDLKIDNDALKSCLERKYTTMKAVKPNIDNEEAIDRLTNYAKAWEFNQFGVKAASGLDVTYENTDCASAKTAEELKQAYKQFGVEYVEFYDQNENDKIDTYELFYQELVEHYTIEKKMTTAEAIKKATEVVKEYADNKYSIINLPKTEAEEAQLFTLVVNKITTLEGAEGATVDSELSADEAAAYLLAMAQFDDKKNAITDSEHNHAQMSLVDEDQSIIQNKMKAALGFLK